MRKINEIILHCTATEEGKNFSVEDVKRWHKERGFSTIGYHFLIDIKGNIQIGRAASRIGAHCIGHNAHSIGVCYVGGLRKGQAVDTRNEAQKTSLRYLIAKLRSRFGNIPVHGHNEFSNKACPCFDAFKEYN